MTQLELILLQINYYLFKYTPVTVSLIINIFTYVCTYIHTYINFTQTNLNGFLTTYAIIITYYTLN